jgi:hypothetical protein
MSTLQITTRIGCANECTYCPQESLIKAYKRRSTNLLMRLDNFKSFIEKLPSKLNIWFAGMCEPWLNPECTQMILYAHKKGHKICVFTTLIGMTLSDIDLIESVPFGFFQIHLLSDIKHKKFAINDDYLAVLNKIFESKINTSFHCHDKNLDLNLKLILGKNNSIEFRSLKQRAGNIKIGSRLNLAKRRGLIGCRRNLRCNVLLPNGDIILCSNDYGMKHVLGNITISHYDSIFNGNEFRKIRRGLRDESIDILCRFCNNLCYNVDLAAKLYNFPYLIDKYIYYLKDLHNLNDLNIILRTVFSAFKKRIN